MEIFSNPEFGNIRMVSIEGDPWFVGVDIAAALGYSNPSKAVAAHVDPEDKQIIKAPVRETRNGHLETKTAFVNESGLYGLILLSKLPNAKKFKRWVTSEILPAIHRTGHYEPHEEISVMVTETDRLIKCAEIMAGCLMGNRQYVLNIIRHIVPDVDEVQKLAVPTEQGEIEVPVETNTVTQVVVTDKKPFNHVQFNNYLIDHNISRAWLQAKLGCARSTVDNWATGRIKPTDQYRTKIYEVLELPAGCFDNNSRIRRISR